MKKIISITLFFLFGFLIKETSSQAYIALNRSGITKLYIRLDSAYYYAMNNDTIYIPGGSYNVGNFTINKKLTIFGAGHHQDSSIATGISYLIGNIIFQSGSDTSSITGIYLSGNIQLGSNATNQQVNQLNITRCNVENINLSYDGVSSTTSNSINIQENVIRGILSGGNATNVQVKQNFLNYVQYFNNTVLFCNNIFLAYGFSTLLTYVNACTFNNNIFIYSPGHWSYSLLHPNSSGNIFTRNLFITPQPFPQGTNLGYYNIDNQPLYSIFDTLVNPAAFSYLSNYHLKSTCLGKNYGIDGKDLGIYGTSVPYEEGAIPKNPHIQGKIIAPYTDPSGGLNINIKVKAME